MTHKINTSQLGPIAKRSLLGVAIASALHSPIALSQDADTQNVNDAPVEVIEVRGIVSSLKRAMADKKENLAVSDGIAAEDLGKFPDLNVAESLQRITGVSIDRNGGEGQQLTVRGFGPKLTPPPFHNGDRDDPALAFPVPFCFQGFLPPPRTSDFVFVEAKYLREFFN